MSRFSMNTETIQMLVILCTANACGEPSGPTTIKLEDLVGHWQTAEFWAFQDAIGSAGFGTWPYSANTLLIESDGRYLLSGIVPIRDSAAVSYDTITAHGSVIVEGEMVTFTWGAGAEPFREYEGLVLHYPIRFAMTLGIGAVRRVFPSGPDSLERFQVWRLGADGTAASYDWDFDDRLDPTWLGWELHRILSNEACDPGRC